MSGKFGGGGVHCTVCAKTAYPAEITSFDKKAYHHDCFRCCECTKKMESTSSAKSFEDKLYCTQCFKKNNFAQAQSKVTWTKPEGGAAPSAGSGKWGGGGSKCTICSETVYPAETITYEKKMYHGKCFNCSKCSKTIPSTSSAANFEGELMCTKCFSDGGYARKQAATAKAPGGATGGSVKFAGKFGGGGIKCHTCDKTVYPAEQLSFEKQVYHEDCFTCLNCSKKVKLSGAQGKKDAETGKVSVYCSKCWSDLGLNRAQLNAGPAAE